MEVQHFVDLFCLCHQRMTMVQEVTETLTLTPTCDAREEYIAPVILHTVGDLIYNCCYGLHSGYRLTTRFCSIFFVPYLVSFVM